MTLLMVQFGNIHGAADWSLRALCGRDLAHTAGVDRFEGHAEDVTCKFCASVLAGGAGDPRFKVAPK